MDRVQDINIEVRKVANSKRRKVLEFSTSFIKENKSIFTSLLAGGTGFALGGMAGCGFGAVGGLLTAEGLKAIKKLPSINIPESSKKDIKELVMPITIDALSSYYRVSTEAVQVWQLKESMMKTTVNRKVKS